MQSFLVRWLSGADARVGFALMVAAVGLGAAQSALGWDERPAEEQAVITRVTSAYASAVRVARFEFERAVTALKAQVGLREAAATTGPGADWLQAATNAGTDVALGHDPGSAEFDRAIEGIRNNLADIEQALHWWNAALLGRSLRSVAYPSRLTPPGFEVRTPSDQQVRSRRILILTMARSAKHLQERVARTLVQRNTIDTVSGELRPETAYEAYERARAKFAIRSGAPDWTTGSLRIETPGSLFDHLVNYTKQEFGFQTPPVNDAWAQAQRLWEQLVFVSDPGWTPILDRVGELQFLATGEKLAEASPQSGGVLVFWRAMLAAATVATVTQLATAPVSGAGIDRLETIGLLGSISAVLVAALEVRRHTRLRSLDRAGRLLVRTNRGGPIPVAEFFTKVLGEPRFESTIHQVSGSAIQRVPVLAERRLVDPTRGRLHRLVYPAGSSPIDGWLSCYEELLRGV